MVPPLFFNMKLKLLSALLLFVVSSYADDAKITIKQKSGNETILQLSTNPVITFEGEDLVITNDFTRIQVPLDDVDTYIVSDGTMGIPPVTAKPQFSKGHVVFSGLTKGSPVFVYSVDGKCVSSQKADNSGIVDISLESLPRGTYVVTASNNSIKVINK